MIFLDTLSTFILTSIIACLIPGPAVIYVISKTASRGLNSGFKAVWGLQLGFLFQVIAAISGMSALILKSSIVFTLLKYLGAIYLVYLGLNILLKKDTYLSTTTSSFRKDRSPVLEGIFINLLNPKIAVFFVSYIPQFVNQNGPSPIKQLIILSFMFCIIGTFTTIGYALSSKYVSSNWITSECGSLLKKWVPGTLFIGLGLKLATGEK